MTDYKKMYMILFNKITDVIEELQELQRKTEWLYIGSTKTKIVLLKRE